MSGVVFSLASLLAGAGLSIALSRRPRVSLSVALAAVFVAGLTCLINAGGTLLTAVPTVALARLAAAMPLGELTLALDGLSAWFLLSIGILSMATAVYSWGYFDNEIGHGPIGPVGALVCLLIAGLVLTVCAADVVLFLVGWELMSVSAFLLVGLHHRDPAARRGAWMYLIATHLGTALCVVPVLACLAGRSGSTSFGGFQAVAGAGGEWASAGLFGLGFIGFGTKAGLMPMHVWLPEAHPVAPSPVSALMSGVVIKTGIYGLLRLLTWLPPLHQVCALAVILIALVTGVMGILYALAQRQYKRTLAYSSVENMGIIALGIGVGMLGRTLNQPALAALGLGGALLHVLNHSLFKGLLFLSAGAVLQGTGTDSLEHLGGLARRDRANAILFLLGALAITALPPLNGFVSEFLIYGGLFRGIGSGSPSATAAGTIGAAGLALIGGLCLSAFARLYGIMFLGEPRAPDLAVHPARVSMVAGMSILAVGCLLVGLGSPWLGRMLMRPVTLLLGRPLEGEMTFETLLAPLAWVSGVFVLLVTLGAILVWVRRKLAIPGLAAASQATWGCGYSRATPRMQYTGSSFGWKLLESFRHLVRPHRAARLSSECFAQENRLATTTDDAAVRFAYRPLFGVIARACERLWPLQHGRIQLYLVYIVGALMLVFAVEVWMGPFSSGGARGAPLSPVGASVEHPGPDDLRVQGERRAP